MTVNYNESSVSGTRWVRSYSVSCQNPLEGERQVIFHEETVVQAGAETIQRTQPMPLVVPFDEEATILLLNPLTGEPLGSSITHGELYAMLFSLYIQAATARDAAAGE